MKINLFGRKSIASAIIASTILWLTVNLKGCGITENDIWKFYYEIQKFIKWDLPNENDLLKEIRDQMNRRIIEDSELLDYRVKRQVDDAINEYERSTGDYGVARIPSPRYSQRPINPELQTGESKLLGGEMRLCAPWADGCPEENKK
jgi:hypothetical protein